MLIGRIIAEHKTNYQILSEGQEYLGTVRGVFFAGVSEDQEFPKVGDFVEFEQVAENKAVIEKICPRKSVVSRKSVGTDTSQAIVANIDYVFVVMGMDGDFIMNIWNGPKALLNQRVLKIETVEDKNQELFKYLKHFLQRVLDRIHRGVGATTVKHLAVSDLKKTKLPIPSNGIEKVNKKLDEIVWNINNSSVKINNSQSLQKSLINQIF